jgi:sec-independent protein translocase protein TatC
MLSQQWRLAIVIIAVLAAAVTPTVDPVNMGLVMLPMILLYFVSIGMSHLAYALRRRNETAAETPGGESQAPAA